MVLPVSLPIDPMLAKATAALPAVDSVPGGFVFEPKWDGFRCVLSRDGEQVELGSRGAKSLTRYFPELVRAVLIHLPDRCVLDCEIVVRSGEPGVERLDWDALGQRIHPAASRVAMLSEQTPAEIIAFDLLALGEQDLTPLPYRERRSQLALIFADRDSNSPIHLSKSTTSRDLAQTWFEQFEGAGLDGVVAKAQEQPYQPGKRGWLKIKHQRTAEAVVLGYRIHKSGVGVGSLLIGLYADDGKLVGVGGVASFTNARRLELIDELAQFIELDDAGFAVRGETEKSRFSGGKDSGYVKLRPEKVVEVGYNQMEAWRFRHPATFLRWRPDRDPMSCTFDQVDRAIAYDLGAVLEH